jgi:hypothetical protein
MRLTPQSIRRVDGWLVIEGPQGPVRLHRNMYRIEAQYQGDQLVNGSAVAYSQQLLEQAIELTNQFPFPWTIDSDGIQRIIDHTRYYEQTFNPDLQGIETLKRWIHQPSNQSV